MLRRPYLTHRSARHAGGHRFVIAAGTVTYDDINGHAACALAGESNAKKAQASHSEPCREHVLCLSGYGRLH